MTREEAIKALERIEQYVGIHYVNGVEDPYISPYLLEAVNVTLTLLRPITQEQVEKVWRGEWKNYLPPLGTGNIQYRCTRCGKTPDDEMLFCPYCGAAMTDEAMQMVMERLEALKDGSQTYDSIY